jgi:tetratricopeptide (TPR) repeat protein
MGFPLRSAVFVSLFGLAALLGSRTYVTPAQAQAGQNHREPILISGVREPDEMRVEPFPVANSVPTAPERMLADAMKSVGSGKPDALLPALNQILAKYPDYSDGYVMRLGALCEGNDLIAISADINKALKYLGSSRIGSSSLSSLLSMRAKIEHSNRDDKAAIDDLDKAIHANLDKALELYNSGAVAPEKTASICVWTEPDFDALVQHFSADYRPYMFRALYHGFFLFFEKDEKAQQASLSQAFDDLNRAATINPSSVLPLLFKAEIFEKTFFFQMMSIYDPRNGELNKTMLSLLDSTLSVDRNNIWALGYRALIYSHLQNWRQAIADYDSVLALDPNNLANLNDRALAKLQIGDTYGAISDLSEVIRKQEDAALHSQSSERAQYAGSYEARADAYMKTQQLDLAIRDFTTAISLQVSGQIWLANIHQFRALYPEYGSAADETIARKLQQTFFPNFSYDGFAERFLHKNGSFGFPDFVIADIFLKRSDAYLSKGNWHAAKLDFKRAERGYPNGPGAIDRWREISPLVNARVYVDIKTFSDEGQPVNLWIKEVRGDNGPYSIEQIELNCRARQLRMITFTGYDASGNLTGSRRGDNWTSIVPDTLGENLYDGVCRAN